VTTEKSPVKQKPEKASRPRKSW